MSRIGKSPIQIPSGVTLEQKDNTMHVKGPKGQVSVAFPKEIVVAVSGDQIVVSTPNLDKDSKSLHGLMRTLIQNAVTGTTTGWEKTLELVGVGYRVSGGGNEVILSVGFSHPVKFKAPDTVTFTIKENKVIVAGIDKKLVGETAAKMRAIKPPEPYKGKGIRYSGEVIRKKAGKAVKAAA